MEFFLVRITYDVAGVDVYSKWGAQENVVWNEIDAVRFSQSSQNYVVSRSNGKTFTFSSFMSGYQSLLDEIEKTPGERNGLREGASERTLSKRPAGRTG